MFTSLYTNFALQSYPTWAKKRHEPHIDFGSKRSRCDADGSACPQVEARSGRTASAVGSARIDGGPAGRIESGRRGDRRPAAHTPGTEQFTAIQESGRVLGHRRTLSL